MKTEAANGSLLRRPLGELPEKLQRDVLYVSEQVGTLDSMHKPQSTFGGGWSRVLDNSIADMQQAIDLLSTK